MHILFIHSLLISQQFGKNDEVTNWLFGNFFDRRWSLSQNENPLLFQILLTLKKYFGIAKYEGITQFNQQFYLLLKKVNYLS